MVKAGLTGENRTAKMKIVKAAEKHIPEIIELWKELTDFLKDIDPDALWSRSKNGHTNWEKLLRGVMGSENALVLVALYKGHVVGYSISEISRYPPIYEREIYGFIDDMAVRSDYRRKGIGEQMLGRILQWFESRNIDRIELTVAAKNQLGYSFWKKHGFKDYMRRLYLDRG